MSQTKAQLLGPLVADNVDVNGDLDFDSGTLKLDPTNNRVGINNSSPTTTLDVGGDVKLSGDITLKDLNYTADYPTIRPSLDLAFAQTKQLDSRITFTRNSIGTYTDENGIIKTAAIDAPRFDHDYTTGESLGLLIEESRTNIAPYGNDMSQYSAINITKTANNAVAPDGTTTATKLAYGTTGSTTWYLDLTVGTPASGAGTYTYSVWVKAPDDQPDDYYGCRIAILTTTGNNTEAVFAIGKTWRKISITKTYASETGNIRIHPIIFRNSPGNSDSGKVVPSYVWVWGSQWEQGAFPTSYIPTSGSAVTRSADYASITGTNFTNFYNQTEGTFYAEADTINPYYNTNLTGFDGNNNNYTVLGTGDLPNRFQLRFDDAYPYQVLGFGPNSTTAISSTTPTTTTTSMKIAGAVKQDYVRGYANGESILVDNSFDMISPSALYIGSLNGTSEINPGHIKRIMYYPRVLNNSQLQNITL